MPGKTIEELRQEEARAAQEAAEAQRKHGEARKAASAAEFELGRLSGKLLAAESTLAEAKERARTAAARAALAADVDGLLAAEDKARAEASEDGDAQRGLDKPALEARKKAAQEEEQQAKRDEEARAGEEDALRRALLEAAKKRDTTLEEQVAAERVRLSAVRKHALAAEELLLPEKKLTRFLVWDGSRSHDGACNRWLKPEEETPAQERRRTWRADAKQRVALSRVSGGATPVALPTGVSVRIVSCTREGAAGRDRFVLEVKLKRMHLVRSLLLRVVDRGGVVAYQEVLDQDQIDLLPAARETAEAHDGLDPAIRVQRLRKELASHDLSPYQFRVWISKKQNAFQGLRADQQPKEEPAEQVHDQSLAPFDDGEKKAAVERDAAGVNRCSVKRARLVTVCLLRGSTGHSDPDGRNNRDDAARAAEVLHALEAVNADGAFGPPQPGELRLFLGPEWSFAQKASPYTYSEARKDDLLQRLQQMSAQPAARGWVILPGTVLWGVPNAVNGVEAVFNTLPGFFENREIHRYNKLQFGGDTQEPPDGRGPTEPPFFAAGFSKLANGWERRKAKLDKGTLPDSLLPDMGARWYVRKPAVKRVAVERKGERWTVYTDSDVNPKRFTVYKPGKKQLEVLLKEMFATALDDVEWNQWLDASLQHRRHQFVLSPFFRHDGLRIATEICADHRGARAAMTYQHGDGSGNGKDDGVDLHLLSSADVDPSPWAVVARTGGVFVYLDGSNGSVRIARVERHRAIADLAPHFHASRATRHVGKPTPARELAPPGWEQGSVTLRDLPLIDVPATAQHAKLAVARFILE